MPVVWKFLVRDSDGAIENYHNMNSPWSNPGGGNWDSVGTTHSEAELGVDLIHTGPGKFPTPLVKDGAFQYKKVGTDFVARSQADKDPEELTESKERRDAAMCLLEQQRAAAAAIEADTGSYSAAVRTAQGAIKTAKETDLASHNTNYETVWTEGTNP
jgi:hypothetical protein